MNGAERKWKLVALTGNSVRVFSRQQIDANTPPERELPSPESILINFTTQFRAPY